MVFAEAVELDVFNANESLGFCVKNAVAYDLFRRRSVARGQEFPSSPEARRRSEQPLSLRVFAGGADHHQTREFRGVLKRWKRANL